MLLKIYYKIKPLIPRRLQLGMRRLRARVKLRTHADVWPIDEAAANPPKDWKGWPDGKKFALVLTHDVDTQTGHDRCRDLALLEMEMGVRSSFNFVPERYAVSPDLRRFLVSRGFEVGVHGLKHDGKYFNSRGYFRQRAEQINRYLKDWGASGYRSPSMLHNLDWFHDLDIEYDSSTFDTDPFEPQPTGARTIFPFFVEKPDSRKGFVELPYTLPQDFTLFILMKHHDVGIWKRKVDWIVEHGGMVLVNVHPDYMNFNNECRLEEYRACLYEDILLYIKTKYNDMYWHVLPGEVAKLFSRTSFVADVN